MVEALRHCWRNIWEASDVLHFALYFISISISSGGRGDTPWQCWALWVLGKAEKRYINVMNYYYYYYYYYFIAVFDKQLRCSEGPKSVVSTSRSYLEDLWSWKMLLLRNALSKFKRPNREKNSFCLRYQLCLRCFENKTQMSHKLYI